MSTAARQPDAISASSPRKHRLWRWLLAALVLLLGIIGFLPTIMGARWIYQPLIDQLAADDFRLTIESVRLRWLSPLRFSGIRLSQSDGPALLTIREVKTDRSLLGYLIGGRRLGSIEIIEPTASVELLKDGQSLERIAQAIERARQNPTKRNKQPLAIDVDVFVRQASAKVMQGEAADPLVVVPPFDVQASYQAAQVDSPTARLVVEPTQILDHVKITKELIDIGLGHAVPLLAKSAWFDGSVSLSVGKIEVPLVQPKQATGTMQLSLHQVRSGPNHPAIVALIDFVGRLRQKESAHELVFVDDSLVNISVANQRISHDGLAFGLPKMDSRFQISTSGSVGMEDRSLDLLVNVPVPIEQLARREQVQQLGVPTLRLPIKGTLDDPNIDWTAMRGDAATLLTSIRQALGDEAPAAAHVVGALEGLAEGKADEAIGAAVDALQQFRQRRQKRETEGGTKDKRPLRDLLRGKQ